MNKRVNPLFSWRLGPRAVAAAGKLPAIDAFRRSKGRGDSLTAGTTGVR
jgi:hypothetical protein